MAIDTAQATFDELIEILLDSRNIESLDNHERIALARKLQQTAFLLLDGLRLARERDQ